MNCSVVTSCIGASVSTGATARSRFENVSGGVTRREFKCYQNFHHGFVLREFFKRASHEEKSTAIFTSRVSILKVNSSSSPLKPTSARPLTIRPSNFKGEE